MGVVVGMDISLSTIQLKHPLESFLLFSSFFSVNTVTITGTSVLRDIHQSRFVKSLSVSSS
jgi:hypothetical protein